MAQKVARITTPDISELNFDDTDDIVGFAVLLITCADRMDMFVANASQTSSEGIRLMAAARSWIEGVKLRLPAMTRDDALTVAGYFDIVHRIGFRAPAGSDITDRYKLAAFEARLHGDRSVSDYRLYRSIDIEIKRRNRLFLDKPLHWNSLCIDRWWNNFRYGMPLNRQSDHDTIQQAAILIGDDLKACCLDQIAFKRRIFDNHRYFLDGIECMPHHTLRPLAAFLAASRQFMTPAEYTRYDHTLFSTLISHPATNRFHRRSLQLPAAI